MTLPIVAVFAQLLAKIIAAVHESAFWPFAAAPLSNNRGSYRG